MTDNTSPVATLSAKLPKGNGLTRAVEKLHGQNGSLVYGVVAIRIEESAEDRNQVHKIKTSLERLELCFGPATADVRDLMTRASADATSVTGQQSLFAGQRSDEQDDEERRGYLRDILEWGLEQEPKLDVEGLTDRWNSWHGGWYDARMDSQKVVPAHLREFAITIGALPDPEMRDADNGSGVEKPEFNDGTTPGDQVDGETVDGDETPEDAA